MKNFAVSCVAAIMLYLPYIWCKLRHENIEEYGLGWKVEKNALYHTLCISAVVLLLLTPVAFNWPNTTLPHKRTLYAALNMIAAGLAAAVIEETFYRGWLETLLKRKINVYAAAIVVNILFASSHLILFPNNRWLLVTFFPGLIMSFLREKYDSILPSIIFHFLGNVWSVWFFPL